MTVAERIALTARLGEQAIEFLMAAHHVDRTEALRRIRHSRSAGRVASACHDAE